MCYICPGGACDECIYALINTGVELCDKCLNLIVQAEVARIAAEEGNAANQPEAVADPQAVAAPQAVAEPQAVEEPQASKQATKGKKKRTRVRSAINKVPGTPPKINTKPATTLKRKTYRRCLIHTGVQNIAQEVLDQCMACRLSVAASALMTTLNGKRDTYTELTQKPSQATIIFNRFKEWELRGFLEDGEIGFGREVLEGFLGEKRVKLLWKLIKKNGGIPDGIFFTC